MRSTSVHTVPRLRTSDQELCEVCKYSDHNSPRPITDVKRGFEAGCPTCGIIYNVAQAAMTGGIKVDVTHVACDERGLITMKTTRGIQQEQVFTYSTDQQCSLPFVPVQRDLTKLKPERDIAVVTDWIKNCVSSHTKCGVEDDMCKSPTRVIYVGTREDETIRICLRKGIGEKYVALSHCWGQTASIREACTTKENLAERCTEIQQSVLPRNFVEAIALTRALGIKYLWIDTLCILQDDADDWNIESSKMADVYHGAYLVIGANGAKNSDCGFLAPGTPFPRKPPIAEILNSDNTLSTICVRSPHYDAISPISNFPDPSNHLAQRSWAMQEQVLARRMVHFTARELFWECRSRVTCECLELEHAVMWDYSPSDPFRYVTEYKSMLEKEILSGSLKSWHSLVDQYHRRTLTYASDFLPALSGIIKHLQNVGAGRCLAGLWADHLVDELLWRADNTGHRAMPYRGPSWSWVSVRLTDSKSYISITFLVDDHGPCQPLCDILEASTETVGLDANGAVASGTLTIRTKLFSMGHRKRTRDTPEVFLYDTHSAETPRGYLDVTRDTRHDISSRSQQFLTTEFFAILVGSWSPGESSACYLQSAQWAGLVLQRTSTTDADYPNTFERVGIWTLNADESRDNSPDILIKVAPVAFFEDIPASVGILRLSDTESRYSSPDMRKFIKVAPPDFFEKVPEQVITII